MVAVGPLRHPTAGGCGVQFVNGVDGPPVARAVHVYLSVFADEGHSAGTSAAEGFMVLSDYFQQWCHKFSAPVQSFPDGVFSTPGAECLLKL